MADCSFLEGRNSAAYAVAGGAFPAAASADAYPEVSLPSRHAAARGQRAAAFSSAVAPARREGGVVVSGMRWLFRGVGRTAVACCCCCGVGSRLLHRLLWVPSSLFLPLDNTLDGAANEQQQDDETAYGLSMPYRSPRFSSTSAGATRARAAAAATENIWKSYFFGQLANVAKAAVWWSMFGVLVLSLAGPAAAGTAVGVTRAAFNLALVLASPVAGACVARRSIRGLLATTTATRLIIWSLAVPAAAWFALSSDPKQQQHSWPHNTQQQQQLTPLPYEAHSVWGKDIFIAADQQQHMLQQQILKQQDPDHSQQQPHNVNLLPEQHMQGHPDAAADNAPVPDDASAAGNVSAADDALAADSAAEAASAAGGVAAVDGASAIQNRGVRVGAAVAGEVESSSRIVADCSRNRGRCKRREKKSGRRSPGSNSNSSATWKENGNTKGSSRRTGGERIPEENNEAPRRRFAEEEDVTWQGFAVGRRLVAENKTPAAAGETSTSEGFRVLLDEAAARDESSWIFDSETQVNDHAKGATETAAHVDAAPAVVEEWEFGAATAADGEDRLQQGEGHQKEEEEEEKTVVMSRRHAADGEVHGAAVAAAIWETATVSLAKESPSTLLSMRDGSGDRPSTHAAASSFSAVAAQPPAADIPSSAAHSSDDAAAGAAVPIAAASSLSLAPVRDTSSKALLSRAPATSSSISLGAPAREAGVLPANAAASSLAALSSVPAVSLPPRASSDSWAAAVPPSAAAVPPSAAAVSPSAAASSPGHSPAAAANTASAGGWAAAGDAPPLDMWGVERKFFDAAAAGAAAAAASARAGGTMITAAVAQAWGWVSSTCAAAVKAGLTQEQLLWILVALMFVDGLQVAFANAVDIDCGGLETLGLQYDLPLSEEVRTALNTRHQFVFDFSFIFFTPPVALLVCLLSRLFRGYDLLHVFGTAAEPLHPQQQPWLQMQEKLFQGARNSAMGAHAETAAAGADSSSFNFESTWSLVGDQTRTGLPNERAAAVLPLLVCMSVVFGGLSLLSLLFYCCGLPRKTVQEEQQEQHLMAGSGPAGRDHRETYLEEEEEEQQQKLQRQQQRWDFFGSPVNNATGASTAAEGRGRTGGWEGSSGSDACEDDGNNSDMRSEFSSSSVQTVSLFQETVARLEDLREGFTIVLREKALGWRLIFLALETALEDSMVSVVVPQIALTHFSSSNTGNNAAAGRTESSARLHMPSHVGGALIGGAESSSGSGNNTDWIDWLGGRVSAANLFAVCVIAVGKVGGCLAGFYMNRHWVPPASQSRGSGYKVLFWSVFGSSLAVLLLPLSRLLLLRQLVPEWAAVALVLLSTFAFFLFSTAPKIGFASLLQGLVSSQLVACKVFGFVGTFVTLVDAGVIAAINLLFSLFPQPGALQALTAVSTVYLLHGIVEALVGPLVILESTASSSDLLLVQRQRSNSTLDDREGADLAAPTTAFRTATESKSLRAVPTQQGVVLAEDNNLRHSPWGVPAANCVRDCWSPEEADAVAPLKSFADATRPTATTVQSRKSRRSHEILAPEAASTRKSSSSRLPSAANATHVDMR